MKNVRFPKNARESASPAVPGIINSHFRSAPAPKSRLRVFDLHRQQKENFYMLYEFSGGNQVDGLPPAPVFRF